MVFITHDFSEAIKMGDHIAIMKDGEISQVGTPEEIRKDRKSYTGKFLTEVATNPGKKKPKSKEDKKKAKGLKQ